MSAPPLGRAKILIVDDDALGAAHIAEAVAELGHEPVVATHWTEAMRCFGDDIDLVLMDAVMPVVDGFKLTKVLRSRASSYTPILFLTGLGDAAAKELGVKVGADDFLTKPLDRVELRVRMTAMLRIRRLTRELEAQRRDYARLAHVDQLTGLPNRRSYDEQLEAELAHANVSRRPLSLLLVDIDHFKAVNDTLGHAVGDELLEFMGKLLAELTRRDDWAFRYGGEEFALLARGTDVRAAMVVGERLREVFEARSGETSAGARTCSVGIAVYDPDLDQVTQVDELFAAADANLYRAKQQGRNRVVGPADDATGS